MPIEANDLSHIRERRRIFQGHKDFCLLSFFFLLVFIRKRILSFLIRMQRVGETHRCINSSMICFKLMLKVILNSPLIFLSLDSREESGRRQLELNKLLASIWATCTFVKKNITALQTKRIQKIKSLRNLTMDMLLNNFNTIDSDLLFTPIKRFLLAPFFPIIFVK